MPAEFCNCVLILGDFPDDERIRWLEVGSGSTAPWHEVGAWSDVVGYGGSHDGRGTEGVVGVMRVGRESRNVRGHQA